MSGRVRFLMSRGKIQEPVPQWLAVLLAHTKRWQKRSKAAPDQLTGHGYRGRETEWVSDRKLKLIKHYESWQGNTR